MSTLHIASRCAFFVFVLFSCNTKTKSAKENLSVAKPGMVKTLPQETMNIASLHKKFINESTQHFSVPGKTVSSVESKGGLKIMVNPASLEREDGTPIQGNIDVSILELTNVNDLFKSNAATVSNGRLLASGGSYFIGMENNGNKLKIKNGKTLSVEFPVIKKDEMELFYGERDKESNMNWQTTNVQLKRQFEMISFNERSSWEVSPVSPLDEIWGSRIYKSLNEPVYYYNKKMTLGKLIDTLNKNYMKVFVQTTSFWPKNLPTDRKLDTNYLTQLYGPRKQYILKVCKEEQKENEAIERRKAIKQEAIAKWQPHSLAGQLQKYYTPSNIRTLGWINIDRYNEPNIQTNAEIELPYAFNDTRIQYFVLFKSINGLISGGADLLENTKFTLPKLPAGEEVTLIAFTKKNGIIYHVKEDFVIQKDKSITLNPKEISLAEMEKIFGANIKI